MKSIIILVLLALSQSAVAQNLPEHIYGTRGETVNLYTPEQVVEAGGAAPVTYSGTVSAPTATHNAGTATTVSRGDHAHGPTAVPQPGGVPRRLGANASAGTATSYSREDHVHPSEVLPLGGAGQCYKTNSAANGVTWGPCDAAGFSSAIPKVSSGTGAAGTGTSIPRDDHVHPSELPAQSSANRSQVLSRTIQNSGTSWVATSSVVRHGLPDQTGHSNQCLKLNANATSFDWGDCGTGGGGTGSSALIYRPITPSGAAYTLQTNESAIALLPSITRTGTTYQTTVFEFPRTLLGSTTQTYLLESYNPTGSLNTDDNMRITMSLSGNVVTINRLAFDSPATFSIAAYGVTYPTVPVLSDSNPLAAGTASAGTGDMASRDDHVHPSDDELPPLAGQGSKYLQVKSDASGVQWSTVSGGGGNVTYSTTATAATVANTAGSADNASRGDHAHGPTPTTYASTATAATTANAGGTSDAVSRGDHAHGPNPETATNKATITANRVLTDANTVKAAANETKIGAIRQLPAFTGKANSVLRLNSSATTALWDTPTATVTAGLPAITGHAGNVLTVNSGATGLEWKAAGGGGGGGGGDVTASITALLTGTVSNRTAKTFNLSASQRTSCRAADWLLFEAFEGGTDPAVASAYQFQPAVALTTRAVSGDLTFDEAFGGENIAFDLDCSKTTATLVVDSSNNPSSGKNYNVKVSVVTLAGGGGGGGGGNPTIPQPTVAGKLQLLRVNAAGSAYELSVPPEPIPDHNASVKNWYLQVNSNGTGVQWDPIRQVPASTQANEDNLLTVQSDGSIRWSDKWPDLVEENEQAIETIEGKVNDAAWTLIDGATVTVANTGSPNWTYTLSGSQRVLLFNALRSRATSMFRLYFDWGIATEQRYVQCDIPTIPPYRTADTAAPQRLIGQVGTQDDSCAIVIGVIDGQWATARLEAGLRNGVAVAGTAVTGNLYSINTVK